MLKRNVTLFASIIYAVAYETSKYEIIAEVPVILHSLGSRAILIKKLFKMQVLKRFMIVSLAITTIG